MNALVAWRGFNEAAHCEPHPGYCSPDGGARGKGRRTVRVVISWLQPAAVPTTAVFSAGARVRTTRIGRVSAAPVAFLRTTTAPESYVEPRRPRRSEAKAPAPWRRYRRSPKSILTRTLLSSETGWPIWWGRAFEEAYDEADDILGCVKRIQTVVLADAAAQDWPKIIQEFLETDKKVALRWSCSR